jgi:hypothetical protein
MPAKRLRDLMPKRPRYHETLPDQLGARATELYRRLAEVPFLRKQTREQWLDRFCYDPDPAREIAVWEWLAAQYEERTASVSEQREKNRIFKELLTQAMDYEPLGVRKLPE